MLCKIKAGDCNYGYRQFPSHHVEYGLNVSVNHTYCSLLSSETYNAPSITISLYTPVVGFSDISTPGGHSVPRHIGVFHTLIRSVTLELMLRTTSIRRATWTINATLRKYSS